MTISICIATFRRPDNLRALLADIAGHKPLPNEVIVVDNDANESARAVIDARRQEGMPCALIYEVQPRQNISLTRNRTVALASGEWLAFLDDDERVMPGWLKEHMATIDLHAADGSQGPVTPVVPPDAPDWIRRGRFYDWPRMQTGRVVPRNRLRFGNIVLRATLVKQFDAPFDPAYGLTGGEDGDLLARLVNAGARIVWCDEAIVEEPVVASRLSFAWLARRSLRGGQDFARHFLAGRYGPASRLAQIGFALRAGAQSFAALGLAAFALLRGRHAAAHWLLKAAANAGKLTVYCGWHYREYAAPPSHLTIPPTL